MKRRPFAAGRASGDHRVERAIIQALDSPLLYGSDIGRARRILFDIYTSDEEPLYIDEMNEIEAFMQQLDSDIEVIWGTSTDNSLGKDAKVIILAAAMAHEMQVEDAAPSDATQDEAYYRALMQKLYVDPKAPVRTVIEKEFDFKDEEPTEASPAEDTPSPTERAGERPSIVHSQFTKPTFLQKAIHWLASLTEE